MKYILKLFILFLSIATQAMINDSFAETSLSEQLARCAAIGNKQDRLACYDALARNVSSNASQTRHLDLIQPPATFLDSHLVAEAWKAEYKLTIRGFVNLISHAVMNNKQRVTVQGWSRDKQDYVLHITMRTPVKLHFLPRKSDNENTPMSLLREVTMDGYTIGAGQFIFIIAAMNPNENTGDANAQSLPDSQ